MKTFYYTVEQDIHKRENTISIYNIYDNYPHYENTLFYDFNVDITEAVIHCLNEMGYNNFNVSRL